PVHETLQLSGNMSSTGLAIHTTTINTLVRDISARYNVTNGNADVDDLKAGVLGGNLNGTFKMHDVTGEQRAELHAAVNNIALAAVQGVLNAQAARNFVVTGGTTGTVDATWRKTFDNLAAHTDMTLNGTIAPKSS